MMATLLRPGPSLMSRKGTRQPVVLYDRPCHIKMSHYSVLGGCRYEPYDNAGGKGFYNRDVGPQKEGTESMPRGRGAMGVGLNIVGRE